MKNNDELYLLGGFALFLFLFRKSIFPPSSPALENVLSSVESETSYLGQKGKPPSLRNNNPGNIIKSKTPWKGKINGVPPGTDPRFEAFKDWHHGIRAMIKNLKSYYAKNNLRTIRGIINKWAPPHENNTAGYITKVALDSGILADVEFEWNFDNVSKIVKAMADMESGIKNTVSQAQFNKAWNDV